MSEPFVWKKWFAWRPVQLSHGSEGYWLAPIYMPRPWRWFCVIERTDSENAVYGPYFRDPALKNLHPQARRKFARARLARMRRRKKYFPNLRFSGETTLAAKRRANETGHNSLNDFLAAQRAVLVRCFDMKLRSANEIRAEEASRLADPRDASNLSKKDSR